MKYKIIKGSEKDFEQAPEWAMQVESLDSNTLFYTEAINGSQTAKHLCQWGDESISRPLARSANNIGGGFKVIAQRRLITEPVWFGEGLPPVGVECELYDCEAWKKVKVKFIGDKYAVLQDLNFDVERVYCVAERPDKFRPIRSPDDVARDEAIDAMMKNSCVIKEITCGLIYDAIAAGKIPGVTKTPTVSELMRVTENATREDCEAIVKMLSGK